MPRSRRRRRTKQPPAPANAANAKRTLERIQFNYEMGQRANEGSKSMSELVDQYGRNERTIRQARLFARRVDPRTFKRLCAIRRTSDGQPLHWGYFHSLATVDDPEKMLKLAKQAADQDWKPNDLFAHMGRKRSESGPRQLTLRDKLAENLDRLADDARLWARRCRQVIARHFGEGNGRGSQVGGGSVERLRAASGELRSAEKALRKILGVGSG